MRRTPHGLTRSLDTGRRERSHLWHDCVEEDSHKGLAWLGMIQASMRVPEEAASPMRRPPAGPSSCRRSGIIGAPLPNVRRSWDYRTKPDQATMMDAARWNQPRNPSIIAGRGPLMTGHRRHVRRHALLSLLILPFI